MVDLPTASIGITADDHRTIARLIEAAADPLAMSLQINAVLETAVEESQAVLAGLKLPERNRLAEIVLLDQLDWRIERARSKGLPA
jgi:hypothetical protein